MNFILKYDALFWQDLKEAVDWYDEISKELCLKFLENLFLVEQKIEVNPYAYNYISGSAYRRILFKTFPYKIYYKIEGNEIFILALAHTSRSNNYTKRRLGKRK